MCPMKLTYMYVHHNLLLSNVDIQERVVMESGILIRLCFKAVKKKD